jgi:ribonuclease HII
MNYIIGIDEVGRGSLAGPIFIGIFLSNQKNIGNIIKNSPYKITDSKKVTEKRRQEISKYLFEMKRKNLCDFEILSMNADKIDKYGISFCLKSMIKIGLEKINGKYKDDKLHIYLDGGLYAPDNFIQKTIIKGDELEPSISCASILAKVSRDDLMKKISKKYDLYFFEKNVGYGTREHIKKIKENGLSEIHRVSFCKNLI